MGRLYGAPILDFEVVDYRILPDALGENGQDKPDDIRQVGGPDDEKIKDPIINKDIFGPLQRIDRDQAAVCDHDF